MPGGTAAGMVFVRGETQWHPSDQWPTQRLGLRKFLEAPSIVVNPHRIEEGIAAMGGKTSIDAASDHLVVASRRDVIKYVAHHLGGTHLGDAKTERERRLWESLTMAGEGFMLLEKPAYFYEVLSIGRLVAESQDADRFLGSVGNSG